MADTNTISKSQLKKLAKQKAREEAKAKKEESNPKIVAPTAEQDYQHRCQYSDEQRQLHSTLYQPPMKGLYLKWTSIIDTFFRSMKQNEMISNHSDKLVTLMGQVSSCRSAGKLGFLTLYFNPENIYDRADINQIGVIIRPEIQILIRPQTFQIANIKQIYKTDPLFPGLQIPKYHIDIKQFDSEEDKNKATIEYIKQLSRKNTRVFDQYYVIGYPGYSDTGERTIYAKHIFPVAINHLMANSIHGAEEHHVHNFSNLEVAYRNPFLRWMYDTKSLHTQIVRSKFQENLRKSLSNDYKLMEVDIPHLLSVASGANAKPFKTHQDDGDIDYMLRIAPELELKMCIVGGLSVNGVFNIGSQFRNEGQDTTHNPEFRSAEFYMRMKSFYELLKASEDIISHCCTKTLEQTRLIKPEDYTNGIIPDDFITSSVFTKEDGTGFRIKWAKPFVNINFIDGINQNLNEGFTLPEATTFENPETLTIIQNIADIHKVSYKPTDSISKILDNMFDDLVLPNTYRDDLPNSYFKEKDSSGNLIISPVTIFGHPKVMSPLAMEMIIDDKPSGIVYRFESFVAGMEICNAYQELSDPKVQKSNFETQQKFQDNGDEEAMNANHTFMKALEYGMCPVAGWGMGMERMYMLLTDNYSIKSVLPFPQLKPEVDGKK